MASRGEALKTYTIRHKLENFHVYFWILKDFAWTSDDRPLAWFSGILALAYLVGLVGFAFRIGDYEETYMLTGTFLWLFGNFWWMAGEVGMFGSDEKNTPQAGFIFAFAILWNVVYYVALKPFRVLGQTNPTATAYFEGNGLYPREYFNGAIHFANFREYEYLHTLFWVCKDLSWNIFLAPAWIVSFAFTFGIGADFVWLSRGAPVECAHYIAQFLWVTANFAWAIGEFFDGEHDEPFPITKLDRESLVTGRWWAQIILVLACVPGLFCYGVYVPFIQPKGEGEVGVVDEETKLFLAKGSAVDTTGAKALAA
mmetsp:Transcript_11313/g.40047  ORF Transcript_11313/g.40047 Transcript_11313/m.40047 type:complete len:312 (+) Transcript_11313:86-1021(+)